MAFEDALNGRQLRDTGYEGGRVEEKALGADHWRSFAGRRHEGCRRPSQRLSDTIPCSPRAPFRDIATM
jgi:hypothetical protein